MNNDRVTIVDYGSGNLYSVKRALEFCGADRVVISSNPADVLNADRVILPGVGAFADGIRGLHERNLVDPIKQFAGSGEPLLGICLGMQLLGTQSEEFGDHKGLNIIPGDVVVIPSRRDNGTRRKIPFIGWAELNLPEGSDWSRTPLNPLLRKQAVYFVHSFHFKPGRDDALLATYDFDGCAVTAAVKAGNVTGLQFHPEKSGRAGLAVVSEFLKSSSCI